MPGGQGGDIADSGREQKDGQGLMNGQDFETKCLFFFFFKGSSTGVAYCMLHSVAVSKKTSNLWF